MKSCADQPGKLDPIVDAINAHLTHSPVFITISM
jgi:hypothetical protein